MNEANDDDDNGLATGGELNMAPDVGDRMADELRETREELTETREELRHMREQLQEVHKNVGMAGEPGALSGDTATESPPLEDEPELDVGREP